ncbi:frequency clock protein [Xylaria venustula]|nr:frequency clock protein [Xylaria venustula]
MADPKNTEAGLNLPPTPKVTYTNPRRTSPENSITLRHHRLARDASRRHPPPTIPNAHSSASRDQMKPPRRNSSEESHETRWSDPRLWFDQSNQNPKNSLDPSGMDVDPPFYQKETDSSNEEALNLVSQLPPYGHFDGRHSFRPSIAKSSSADDYRSVIDDLTIENKRLKEELRKFKQMGPNSLRNDKLFEVKVHGLPSKKKRELEATLRDFTTKLERSSAGASTSRKKASGKSKEGNSSASKHASSTSGSNSRPVDSAYASMGTGPSSSTNPTSGQGRDAARLRNNQNIEEYLRDIPEGLWPRPTKMTEHEKKKLVVKRLEHLFTGKMGHSKNSPTSDNLPPPLTEDVEMEDAGPKAPTAPAAPAAKEAAREALIRSGGSRKKTSHSSVAASASNTRTQSQSQSNADQSNSNSRDNDNNSGSGSGSGRGSAGKNSSPQDNMEPSEQRPTRPRDLDPDRKQVPADNMEYIRHLGIVAPESEPYFSARDVSPDAEGWVYLNLLGNLAQLHILNVTPDFIRSAVSEKSTKFQLSPDGRKVRWRGGDEGTRFTSDTGSKSQTDRSGDDSDGSNENGQRKKQKGSKFNLGTQNSNSSQDFHYKPLFVHKPTSLPEGQTSFETDTSSNLQSEDSNGALHSKWDQSGISPGQSQRKRRRDGAIIYYSGAPFCTDLSGDYGEVSPDTYDMTSSDDQQDQVMQDSVQLHLVHRPYVNRSPSGSSIQMKPLSDSMLCSSLIDPKSNEDAESSFSDTDSGIEADFPWSDSTQQSRLTNLEASGLGGVCPDDHFVVIISTRRPKTATTHGDDTDGDDDDDDDISSDGNTSIATRSRFVDRLSHDTAASRGTADSIASKVAKMSTKSPLMRSSSSQKMWTVRIKYGKEKIRRLPPVPLPPPAFYFPSGDSESDDYGGSVDDDRSVSSERSILSKRPMIEGSPGSDNRELSGNDEEDEDSDDSPGFGLNRKSTKMTTASKGDLGPLPLSKVTSGSSVATAGGAGSGYNSSMEDA